MKEIYADHAATTFPRHPQLVKAITSYLADIGTSPGRGGYRRSLDASRLVYETRNKLASFFNVPDARQVIFTPGVTYSLNMVIKGVLNTGDHVLISSMEHNAVVRPLSRLIQEKKIIVEQIPCSPEGILDIKAFKKALQARTRLVILNHASNVTGTLLPVSEIGEILAKTDTLYCVDTAQTAGTIELDFQTLRCDYLTFTGHKGLQGPPGIGGICISEKAAGQTQPLVEGGTGSRSEDINQPQFLPDKFESGTPNVPGIAGLSAGLQIIEDIGLLEIYKKKKMLTAQFLSGLSEIPAITVYGTKSAENAVSAVSLNLAGVDSGDLSFILEQAYGIMTRSGLHCSPLAHQTMGTYPRGTLRFSFGCQNTPADIEEILVALKEIAKTSG